ncbi:MAG: SpoIID/LytB domain-containing protein [Clostridia bacterium]|nr:SpoIID/LytB domain-containing protein [Clostridia bacterium]
MQMINKKAFFSFFLITVLIFSLFVPTAGASVPEKVKIGLFYGSGAKDSYTVSSGTGIVFARSNDEVETKFLTDETLTEVTVKKNKVYSTEYTDVFESFDAAFAKAAELSASGTDAYCYVSGSNYTVRTGAFSSMDEAKAYAELCGTYPVEYTKTGILVLKGDKVLFGCDNDNTYLQLRAINGNFKLNNVSYRGSIRFLRASENDMAAINILPLEEYLYSVLPKEVSASWNEEALKAQAVVARTFTITNLNKFASFGFNLDNTTASQVYGGAGVEDERTTKAVDATRGEIVKYDGAVASVFYYSSSGGKTSNSEDVWTATLPYLRSVEDLYENPDEASYARWSETFTKAQVKETLASKGIDIGDILDIVVNYSESGRAVKLTFIGTRGAKEYLKDNIRASLSLKSTNFKLTKSDTPVNLNVIDGSLKIRSADFAKNISVVSKDGINTLNTSPKLLSSSGITTVQIDKKPADSYTFTGGGWGHGVGMSQWGAKGMADNGFSYKDIITHYFSGVQVETY